jgi:hypothetical protein
MFANACANLPRFQLPAEHKELLYLPSDLQQLFYSIVATGAVASPPISCKALGTTAPFVLDLVSPTYRYIIPLHITLYCGDKTLLDADKN